MKWINLSNAAQPSVGVIQALISNQNALFQGYQQVESGLLLPGSYVSEIIAGTNVTISPAGGTGAVTINASSGGSVFTVAPPVSGYMAWYDASQITGVSDGAGLSSWSDLSGNGYTLIQGTSGNQPIYHKTTWGSPLLINGNPAVYFANAPNYMVASGFPNQAQPITFFAVLTAIAFPSSSVIFVANQNVTTNGSRCEAYFTTAQPSILANTTISIGTALSALNRLVIAGQFNGASSWVTWSGGGATYGNAGSDSFGTGGLLVGAVDTSSGYLDGLDALLGELIIYPSALTPTQSGSIMRNLALKWGPP